MGMSPNPIVSSTRTPHLEFSTHARFRMEERDVNRVSIEKLLTSPRADFRIDERSGSYVFRPRDYRIVVKKGPEDSFLVTSIFKTNQRPG